MQESIHVYPRKCGAIALEFFKNNPSTWFLHDGISSSIEFAKEC